MYFGLGCVVGFMVGGILYYGVTWFLDRDED